MPSRSLTEGEKAVVGDDEELADFGFGDDGLCGRCRRRVDDADEDGVFGGVRARSRRGSARPERMS